MKTFTKSDILVTGVEKTLKSTRKQLDSRRSEYKFITIGFNATIIIILLIEILMLVIPIINNPRYFESHILAWIVAVLFTSPIIFLLILFKNNFIKMFHNQTNELLDVCKRMEILSRESTIIDEITLSMNKATIHIKYIDDNGNLAEEKYEFPLKIKKVSKEKEHPLFEINFERGKITYYNSNKNLNYENTFGVYKLNEEVN